MPHWHNLSDPRVEEALYDAISMREFVGIDLGCKPMPEEMTCVNFVTC
ncbi:MAG: transposase [Glaciimonas sp.]|nr:transposase [Glaciimonas sp.]